LAFNIYKFTRVINVCYRFFVHTFHKYFAYVLCELYCIFVNQSIKTLNTILFNNTK